MRHFYFRFVLGIVFAVCAVFSFLTGIVPFGVLYVVLGGAFLHSACTIRRKEKDNREE